MIGGILRAVSALYTRWISRGFAAFGTGSSIRPILNCSNPRFIAIGQDVQVGSFCWIAVSTEFAGISCRSDNALRLRIGNRVSIGNNAFIIANNDIRIGNDVILSNYVYISDHLHGVDDMTRSIHDQPLSEGGFVHIGDNVLIGTKSSILPNVTIGERVVIGANSVVTRDIPPFTMVAGNPARAIKRYDPELRQWVRIHETP